jgi:hypothetical protein
VYGSAGPIRAGNSSLPSFGCDVAGPYQQDGEESSQQNNSDPEQTPPLPTEDRHTDSKRSAVASTTTDVITT